MKFDELIENQLKTEGRKWRDYRPTSKDPEIYAQQFADYRANIKQKFGVQPLDPDTSARVAANNIRDAKAHIRKCAELIPMAKDNSLSTWIPRLQSLINELEKFPTFR